MSQFEVNEQILYVVSEQLYFKHFRPVNNFIDFSRNSPSVTMMSKFLYESGEKVLSRPHLYRPESDSVSCVMLTYRIPPVFIPFLNSMLYLPLAALTPSVSVRISSSLQFPLQNK